MKLKLPSCKNCNLKIKIVINNNACKTCLNWNIESGRCSKELVKDIEGHVKNPFQLSLETQIPDNF